MDREQSRGLVAVRDAQPAAGPVQMSVDGVFRNTQLTGDLLGTQMGVNKTKALALALGQ